MHRPVWFPTQPILFATHTPVRLHSQSPEAMPDCLIETKTLSWFPKPFPPRLRLNCYYFIPDKANNNGKLKDLR